MALQARIRGPLGDKALLLDGQLLAQYEADIDRLVQQLSARTQPVAARLAALPTQIRGYGHVRQAQAATAAAARDKLLAELAEAARPAERAA